MSVEINLANINTGLRSAKTELRIFPGDDMSGKTGYVVINKHTKDFTFIGYFGQKVNDYFLDNEVYGLKALLKLKYLARFLHLLGRHTFLHD